LYSLFKFGRDFVFPDYKPQYPRQPNFKISHYRLEVKIDIDDKRIDGLAVIQLENNGETVYLDAVDMDILSVMGGDFDYDGRNLILRLPYKGRHEIRVSYKAWPRTGVYFILPDEHHPDRLPFVWSHGEPEYHRHWMPVYDYPNMKFTTEMLVTVPASLEVVSNGQLAGVTEGLDGWRTWHWVMDVPHSAYLISFVAGIFDKEEEDVDGVKLTYYVPKGMKQYIRNSFQKTGEILRFFSQYLDFPYPYKSYKQVCVPEFVVGGMENTTATTLTDLTLHDDHAHMDFSSDPLVAHELAHQWFGDLVTCRDWSHIWLNESFATYLENLFVRHDKGRDEFLFELYSDFKSYLDEYRKRYSRPIVYRVYRYPEELFDRHAYPKGGLVLHTISNIVGEVNFRKALNLFLRRHQFSNADTEDLRKCLEEASGMYLEQVFEQLVYSSGHPHIKINYKWDEESKTLRLNFKQVQGDDSPETYGLEMEVFIQTDEGAVTKRVSLSEREFSTYVGLSSKPRHICFDPEMKIIRLLDIERPLEEALKAVFECGSVVCRLEMVEFLSKQGGRRVVEVLERVVKNDSFWGVSYHAAKALGEIRSEEAKEALLRCLEEVKHPKVLRGVVEALGIFEGDKKVGERLSLVIRDEKMSYYVRQAACISLGKLKLLEMADVLSQALSFSSHADSIASGALTGLAELGTDESFEIIVKHLDLKYSTPRRVAAVAGLAKFPGKKEVYELLKRLSQDWNERVRHAVVAASRELLDPRLLDVLETMAEKDVNERVRRNAREVAKKIREHLEKGTEYKALREEIEKIREENRKLHERLFKVEDKIF